MIVSSSRVRLCTFEHKKESAENPGQEKDRSNRNASFSHSSTFLTFHYSVQYKCDTTSMVTTQANVCSKSNWKSNETLSTEQQRQVTMQTNKLLRFTEEKIGSRFKQRRLGKRLCSFVGEFVVMFSHFAIDLTGTSTWNSIIHHFCTGHGGS